MLFRHPHTGILLEQTSLKLMAETLAIMEGAGKFNVLLVANPRSRGRAARRMLLIIVVVAVVAQHLRAVRRVNNEVDLSIVASNSSLLLLRLIIIEISNKDGSEALDGDRLFLLVGTEQLQTKRWPLIVVDVGGKAK